MPKLFQFFVVVFALFWCTAILAQVKIVGDTEYDASPYQSSTTVTGEDAIWDLLYAFDVTASSGAAGNAGAEFANGYYYTTRWASNLIHEYDMTGTLIREFSVPGVTGLRDLAYDGTYFYGGASGATIYQMDFGPTPTLIGSIPVSGVTVRNIAYDEANDGFWCGNWADPPTLFDRSGNQLAQIVTGFTAQYGSAYDNVSPGGPFLWVFDQGGASQIIVHQFDIATGTATGVIHDCGLEATDPTGIAGGLWTSTDHTSGFLVMGALVQGIPDEMLVYEIASAGPPCPVGEPTDPNPVNGAMDVDINLPQISWTNGTGTAPTQIEVFFDGVSVYTGAPVTSYTIPGPLDYSTTYAWKVNGSDGTCWKFGPTWSFTTMDNPGITTVFYEDFDGSWPGTWTITNNGGTCDWIIAPDGTARYGTPGASGNLLIADSDLCGSGTTMNTTATMDQGVDMTGLTDGVLYFAHDLNYLSSETCIVEYSIDGGSTWTLLETFAADLTEIWDSGPMPVWDGQADLRFRFTYIAGWDWWWAIDNMFIDAVIPVELTSFTASVNENDVTLNWVTASEINNQGFEIERNSGNGFQTIGHIAGYGTSSETHNYSFVDQSLNAGTYSYRLKQLDLDGTFEYSDVIEVDVTVQTLRR